MELTVNIDSFAQSTVSLSGCERILDRICASIASVRNNISYSAQRNSGAGARLREIEARLGSHKSSVGTMRGALGEISQKYMAMENKNIELCGGVAVGADNASGGSGTQGEASESEPLWKWKNTWDVVSSFGSVGSAIAFIGSLITGATCPNESINGFNVAKRLAKLINKGGKIISESSWDWKSLTEWKVVDRANFDPFKGYSFGNAKGVVGKLSVAAKWAGDIITVLCNAHENIIENDEGNSAIRAVFETIGESAVEIGVGIGVTALLTYVGAPVAVAAAVTVVAKWGLDALCKEFNDGKDFAETVSDAVLDAGEAVIDWTTSTAKKIGDGAKKAGETVCNWFKGLF